MSPQKSESPRSVRRESAGGGFPATRRTALLGCLTVFGASAASLDTPGRRLRVYKTPWCGCCSGWIDHMRRAGWSVEVIEREDLAAIRAASGFPDRLASCHTAVVGSYHVEGHVPAADVDRLLRERPSARGLAVPGMPAGSPGMEQAGREPYLTLLVLQDGSTRVFARHNGA